MVVVPGIKRFGERLGFTDQPDNRKQHKKPLVRLGGIAILLGFLVALVLIAIFQGPLIDQQLNQALILPILYGSIGCFLIGLADDLFAISPWPRLILQIAIGCFIWSQDLAIKALDLGWIAGGERIVLNDFLSIFSTVIWLVGITNAINWIDGLDGLAAGISLIAATFIALLSFSSGQIEVAIVASALIGACVGFLIYNFYPAKIVMGDGGSYFLGFTLSLLSLICFSNTLSPSEFSSFNIFQPLLILAIPIVDMSAVIVTRISKGYSPFYPDRRHIHHRLLRMGISHKQTVLLLYALTQWLGCISYSIFMPEVNIFIICISTTILISTFFNSVNSLKDINNI